MAFTTWFVLGSAAPHAHDLVLGYYSVHTSAEALQRGEDEIRRIGRELRENGTVRASSHEQAVLDPDLASRRAAPAAGRPVKRARRARRWVYPSAGAPGATNTRSV